MFKQVHLQAHWESYWKLSETGADLYIERSWSELRRNSRLRLNFLEYTQSNLEELVYDWQEVYSFLATSNYHLGDYDTFEKILVESKLHNIPLTVEVLALSLSHDYHTHSLSPVKVAGFLQLLQVLDTELNGSTIFVDTELILPIYNETVHNAVETITKLYQKVSIENQLVSTANSFINNCHLAKCQAILEDLKTTRFS